MCQEVLGVSSARSWPSPSPTPLAARPSSPQGPPAVPVPSAPTPAVPDFSHVASRTLPVPGGVRAIRCFGKNTVCKLMIFDLSSDE